MPLIARPCLAAQYACDYPCTPFVNCRENQRKVYVSLGLFTIIKLERNVQLLIPAYDFCIPEKECVSSSPDDPCEIFANISFPVDEFFPPVEDCLGTDNQCCCEDNEE